MFYSRLPNSNVEDIYVVNRGPKSPVFIAAHCNDLIEVMRPLVESGVKIVTIVADGGCDYNANHEINLFYYGRLYRTFPDIDVLMITSCTRPFGNEHDREGLEPTDQQVGIVYFASTLEGETGPPRQQTDLTPQQREEKEVELFDISLEKL